MAKYKWQHTTIGCVKVHQSVWGIYSWSPYEPGTLFYAKFNRRTNIDSSKWTNHHIIKDEIKSFTLDQIEMEAESDINLLLVDTKEELDISYNLWKININEEETLLNKQRVQASQKEWLFLDVWKMKVYERWNGSWYMTEYLGKVRNLLDKYPEKHVSIIKSLKFSKSSYYRLMKYPESIKTVKYWQKIEERHRAGLTAIEEEIVKRLLVPPISPKTLNKI